MKILHTSDWHIGRALHDRRRLDEHQSFFSWLQETLVRESIDILLVCGDVFDTIAPGNRQLELYYSFLKSTTDLGCRHTIIIGGNHDSPSLLDAPKKVLETLGVHVIGSTPQSIEDEVILLRDLKGEPEAIVCAVPFLRDRDVRESAEQEQFTDKAERLQAGVEAHYRKVGEYAELLLNSLPVPVPVIVTGHLFAAGSKCVEDDGVRDLYVGTSAEVPASFFPSIADYVALGHLHVPQKVSGSDTIRYSGSPIPMGFGEAHHTKQVVVVEFSPGTLFPHVASIPIPQFQKLERVSGSLEEIEHKLSELVNLQQSVWVEVEYTGSLSATTLRSHLDDIVADSAVEILRLRNTLVLNRILHQEGWEQTLDDLDEREVFRRRLACETLEPAEMAMLNTLYDSVLSSLREEEEEQ